MGCVDWLIGDVFVFGGNCMPWGNPAQGILRDPLIQQAQEISTLAPVVLLTTLTFLP
jgi:hypothetical protein